MEWMANLLGYVVRLIYDITSNNYAFSIILFTILTKLALFPLNLKQMKSNKEMQKIKPKYDEVMKKYKDNKQKQSEEITKIYAEHKINPLGGCLPLIVQMFLIIAIFYVVKQPLTYVVQMSKDDIRIYTQEVLEKDVVNENEMKSNEIIVANKYNFIDMNFLGLNLGDVPSNSFNEDQNKKANPISLVVPILAVILSVIQIKITQNSMEMTEEQKEMQKSMNLTMPLMSGIISYTMPLALGIYWLLGSLLQIVQQKVIKLIVDEEFNKEKEDVKLLK